jgi:bifunctional non-homologous end joining protein LigD
MMLAATGTQEILKFEEYIFEPKLDGYRALCQKKAERLRFISRTNRDITLEFPELSFGDLIKADCTLDGEIVIYDEKGNPSFSRMQRRKHHDRLATYIAFDILELEGRDLKRLPLLTRKQMLADVIEEGRNLQIMLSTHNGEELWKVVTSRDLEGVMAKRKDSPYVTGRSHGWLKVKREKTVDCVIVGYITKIRKIGSLGLGLYDNGRLTYVGQVGTGFRESLLDKLATELVRSSNGVVLPKNVQPVVADKVCEVKYLEYTRDHRLRAPVFLRIREDKFPEQCTVEQVQNGA